MRKLKVLALKNNPLSERDTLFVAEAMKKLHDEGIEYDVTAQDVSVPLSYKSFDDTSTVKGLWGLDGIKEKIRPFVEPDVYDIVLFFYEVSSGFKHGIAYWTYPNPLFNGEVFIEIPMDLSFSDSIEKAICHESLHAVHRLLQWKGVEQFSDDTIDKYDGDQSPMSGANYQRNLIQLRKNWDALNIVTPTVVKNIPKYIIIHHTADVNSTFDSVKAYHISKGWGNIAYHYFINIDGSIRSGRVEDEVGTHCIASGMNFKSIGICLNGNFEVQKPTIFQINAMNNLVDAMKLKYSIPEENVIAHGKVPGAMSLCCGKNLLIEVDNRKRKTIIELAKKAITILLQLLKLKK